MAGIFKAYDIRGIYPDNLNEELAYKLGRAFVTFLKPKTVLVSRDMRESGESLTKALIKGLTEQGADVIDIGLSTTDMFYFAVVHTGADAGITVTASHNPAKYNGFKMVRSHAIPIGGDSGIPDIEKIVNDESFSPLAKIKGQIIHKDNIIKDFVEYIKSKTDISKIKPLKVVMDAGNGMAGLIAPKMFADTNIEIIPLYFDLDGTFPNHEANPLLEENRQALIAKVKETNADFGVGFDGDSDRAFFVDDNGEFINNDFMTGTIGRYLLESNPGATIVYDVRSSRFVRETIKKAGGKCVMWKVGHAFMKEKMREIGAIIGGEVSGHFYFKFDDFYADNSYLPVFLVAKILSEENLKLSELTAERKKYFISGEINSTVNDQNAVLNRIESIYGTNEAMKANNVPFGINEELYINTIDGLYIAGEKWWFNIRESNTEPLVRLNSEADSKENMENLRDFLLNLIRS